MSSSEPVLRQREVELFGRAMRWTERGEGAAVLAVHSSGMSARQWRKLEGVLPPSTRLVAPDLFGYGESAPWPREERFDFAYDQLALERIVETLAAESGPVHLVGHSYGGFLALLVALHHPARVASIAVYEPVSFGVLRSEGDAEAIATLPAVDQAWPDAPEALEAWLEGFVDYWNGAGGWRAQSEGMRASFRAAGLKMVGEVRTLGHERTPKGAYRSLAMPVLLLGGEHTTLAAKRVLAALEEALPSVERREIAGAGHMGPLTHAADVNAAIADHVLRASRPPQ